MIIKSFEIQKVNLNKHEIVLLYGKNDGLKNEAIEFLTKKNENIFNYEEREILDDLKNFAENIKTQSLFEKRKTIIIKRATDKIFKIFDEIDNETTIDFSIIINAESLDKKSKLRAFFEKNKKYVVIPYYPDNETTLITLASNFFRKENINISTESINLIIFKCNGDRQALKNELIKISHFSKNKKKISSTDIMQLTNLLENHSISEIVDNCLAKNTKILINILNENNFGNEDCILILRTFSNKSKKILKLIEEFEKNKDIEKTISSAKPPIFWKDKEITKKIISKWNLQNFKKLIFKINLIEMNVKKNVNNSVNLLNNFLIEQSSI